MENIKKAKEFIIKYKFYKNKLSQFEKKKKEIHFFDNFSRKTSKLTPEIIANSLHYYIEINTSNNVKELGKSKFYGKPHLPKDFKIPNEWKKVTFWFQYNLEELAKYDVEELLPCCGLVSVFKTSKGIKAIYLKETTNLVERKDIKEDKDADEFFVEFKPASIFYIGGDWYEYKEFYDFLEPDFKDKISKILNCDLVSRDNAFRILGRPILWQGEDDYDEFCEEEFEEEFDGELEEMKIKQINSFLFLQYEESIDDSSIQLWLDKRKSKLGDFTEVTDYGSTS